MPKQTFITFEETSGYRVPESVLINRIAQFNREHFFKYLTRLNNFLGIFPVQSDKEIFIEIQRFLAFNLFSDDLIERLKDITKEITLAERPIFHRQQILLLMRLVLRHGMQKDGYNPNDSEEAKRQIGELCLMASDHTLSLDQKYRLELSQESPNDSSDSVLNECLSQLLPTFELQNPPSFQDAFVRTLEYIAISHKHFPNFFDGRNLSSLFLKQTGISLERFMGLVLVIYFTYRLKKLEEFVDRPETFNINPSTHFSNLDVNEKEIESFFNLLTIKFDDLISSFINCTLSENLVDQYDFIVFRDTPALYLSEHVVSPIDFAFIIEKVSFGLSYTLLNVWKRGDTPTKPLLDHWGDVFEEYVTRLFLNIYPEKCGRFHPRKYFDCKKQLEAFDGMIENPDSLIVMEYKAGLLKSEAKYSGHSDLLLHEMKNKFHFGTADGEKEQLVRKINLLFHSDKSKRLKIRGLGLLPTIKNVYPVLILNDLSMAFGLAHWRLQNWFNSNLQAANIDPSISVKNLLVLTIEDLETIAPHLESGDFEFAKFLEYFSRLKYGNRKWFDVLTDFRAVFTRFLRYLEIEARDNEKIKEGWDRIVNDPYLGLKRTKSS